MKHWFDTGAYPSSSGPVWNSNFNIVICKQYSLAVSWNINDLVFIRYAAAYEYWLLSWGIVIHYWGNINHMGFTFTHTYMYIGPDAISLISAVRLQTSQNISYLFISLRKISASATENEMNKTDRNNWRTDSFTLIDLFNMLAFYYFYDFLWPSLDIKWSTITLKITLYFISIPLQGFAVMPSRHRVQKFDDVNDSVINILSPTEV